MQEASERLGQLTRPEDPAQAGTHTGDTAPDAGERQEDFEELIRGRYKSDFDARVKKILDGRLRGLRQEVTDLRQREKLRQVQIQYYLDRLPEQEKQVRMVHPEFRLQKEMENPRFFRLVQAGVEPREAYEMVHRRELTAKAMHFAAHTSPTTPPVSGRQATMCGRAFSSQMRHGHGMARNMPHDIIKPVSQRFTAIPPSKDAAVRP